MLSSKIPQPKLLARKEDLDLLQRLVALLPLLIEGDLQSLVEKLPDVADVADEFREFREACFYAQARYLSVLVPRRPPSGPPCENSGRLVSMLLREASIVR